VLINITGSSNLKLSEVNEASTIIQNAAHEDCNIIFGAVQDERMGDEVRITVIATGFRQEMPERRARMLAESTLPGADYQVPIRGRSLSGRGSDAPALFASEEREAMQVNTARQFETARPLAQAAPMPVAQTGAAEEAANVREAEARGQGSLQAGRIWVSPVEIDDEAGWSNEPEADDAMAEAEVAGEFEAGAGHTAEVEEDAEEMAGEEYAEPQFARRTEPELVPVAASVFDDDFFRSSPGRGPGASTGEMSAGAVAEPAPDVRILAGGNGSHAETDELDIPAFLRRSR